MDTILAILVALVVLALVVWIVEVLPLPMIPKRIGMAVLGIVVLVMLANHLHWLPR